MRFAINWEKSQEETFHLLSSLGWNLKMSSRHHSVKMTLASPKMRQMLHSSSVSHTTDVTNPPNKRIPERKSILVLLKGCRSTADIRPLIFLKLLLKKFLQMVHLLIRRRPEERIKCKFRKCNNMIMMNWEAWMDVQAKILFHAKPNSLFLNEILILKNMQLPMIYSRHKLQFKRFGHQNKKAFAREFKTPAAQN